MNGIRIAKIFALIISLIMTSVAGYGLWFNLTHTGVSFYILYGVMIFISLFFTGISIKFLTMKD